jgi:hypothetical protein
MSKPFRSDCPDDELFVRAFMKEADLKEKEILISHVLDCARCRKKFYVMQQLQKEASTIEIPQENRQPTFRINQRVAAWAGTLLFLVAAVFLLIKLEKSPAYRGDLSGGLMLIAPEGTLKSPPATFSWRPAKGADIYNFRLIDEDLQTVFEGGVSQTKLTIDENTRSKLVKGKTYIWTIVAYDDQSRTIATGSKSFKVN